MLALDFITAGHPELEEAWRCVYVGDMVGKVIGYVMRKCSAQSW